MQGCFRTSSIEDRSTTRDGVLPAYCQAPPSSGRCSGPSIHRPPTALRREPIMTSLPYHVTTSHRRRQNCRVNTSIICRRQPQHLQVITPVRLTTSVCFNLEKILCIAQLYLSLGQGVYFSCTKWLTLPLMKSKQVRNVL